MTKFQNNFVCNLFKCFINIIGCKIAVYKKNLYFLILLKKINHVDGHAFRLWMTWCANHPYKLLIENSIIALKIVILG